MVQMPRKPPLRKLVEAEKRVNAAKRKKERKRKLKKLLTRRVA